MAARTSSGLDFSELPSRMGDPSLDQLCIDTIRTLSMDAVQTGELGPSGHSDGAGPGRLHAVAGLSALRPD